ncbi:MAG: 4'-phosphopantetheinyl transferase superfamily protein [Gemmatimonadales bacterium]|nr:4'-phosphopantetheinyl transferase superfamily protein [Gemmatimonadales bacterium]
MTDVESTVRFNLAHSGDLALVAVARGREVGVDVERVPPARTIEEVGPLVFCARERERIEQLRPNRRGPAFARLWTRKEAYLKGDGRGLLLPLNTIDVSGRDAAPRLLDESGGEWRMSPRWRIHSLRVATGYAGAVAVDGDGWRLRMRSWPPRGREVRESPPAPPSPRRS